MSATPADVENLLRGLRKDLTDAQTKLTYAFKLIGMLEVPVAVASECPHCGPMPIGARALAEHMHTSHGHPHPDDPPALAAGETLHLEDCALPGDHPGPCEAEAAA